MELYFLLLTLLLPNISAYPCPGTDSGSYYYKDGNVDEENLVDGGIKGRINSNSWINPQSKYPVLH